MNVPKLRFKEFTDEWKIIKLDELYEFKNGINEIGRASCRERV